MIGIHVDNCSFFKRKTPPLIFIQNHVCAGMPLFNVEKFIGVCRKAVKATVILIPLFGLQQFCIIYSPADTAPGFIVYNMARAIIIHSQVSEGVDQGARELTSK